MLFTESVLEKRETLMRFFGQVGEDLGDWRIPLVLAWRHGFDPFDPNGKDFATEPCAQSEVAERLGTDKMKISRLEAEALDHIREHYSDDFRELYGQATQ